MMRVAVWIAGCAAVGATYSTWGEEDVSEMGPLPKLGTYSGEIHHDEDLFTSMSVNLKSRSLADLTFFSTWPGYESLEPLDGECNDIKYTTVSSSLVMQSECLNSLVDKWNAQVGNGRFFDRQIELKFSHDTLDGTEAFGQALVLEHTVDDGDLVEFDWSKLRIQMANEEYPQDINDVDEPSEKKAEVDDEKEEEEEEEDHGETKKGRKKNEDDDEEDEEEEDDDDEDENEKEEKSGSRGEIEVTTGASAAADL